MSSKPVRPEVLCDYCGKPAQLVKGSVLYSNRSDLADGNYWQCVKCKAHVGCHRNSEKPLGRLANRTLRLAKMAAHEALDPLWRGEPSRRSSVYLWLAGALGIPARECHIGMFDEERCRQVVKVVRQREKEQRKCLRKKA